MGYEKYAYDYIVNQGNTDIEDIGLEMESKFKMPWRTGEALGRTIINNTGGHRDRIAQNITQSQETAQLAQTPWQQHPATSKQIQYLIDLGVRLENGMTKARASALIDAAKNSEIGSIGGFYRDGSN
jgi:hypothetical protein